MINMLETISSVQYSQFRQNVTLAFIAPGHRIVQSNEQRAYTLTNKTCNVHNLLEITMKYARARAVEK